MCECDLSPLQALVSALEQGHTVTVVRPPAVCLTMVPARDSLEAQRFYLGEALTTECEVLVDGQPGYGLCLGDEPVRGYCIAVVDALVNGTAGAQLVIQAFLDEQAAIVGRREQEEFNLILRTQVDFKLMEEG